MTGFTDNWVIVVIAIVVLILIAWWLGVASRRTRIERDAEAANEGLPARRNQALIDAASADADVIIPPAAPVGLAGAGEAVAAMAVPAREHLEGDDLKRIKGVGPKLEAVLNSLGVTRYSQIAAWDDSEIERIDAQLGTFAGRIRRDDWPAQAKFLETGDTAGFEGRFGKM